MEQEEKDKLKNILFQYEGITYDDFYKDNNPFVGLFLDTLIKAIEEYERSR